MKLREIYYFFMVSTRVDKIELKKKKSSLFLQSLTAIAIVLQNIISVI